MNKTHQYTSAVIAMIPAMAAFLTPSAVAARTYYVATSGETTRGLK